MKSGKKRNLKKNGKTLSGALFFTGTLTLLGACAAFLLLAPQREFSPMENRYLTKLSAPSLDGFLDGTVQENLTDATADQFPGRDVWVGFAASLQRAAGRLDSGGVCFGSDGYYFEKTLDSDISKQRFQNNLAYLETLAGKTDATVTFLPVPSAGVIYPEKLPDAAAFFDAEKLYQDAESLLLHVSLLDIRDELADRKDRSLYFRTDHHWTAEGAYTGYAAYCGQCGMEPVPFSDFSPACCSRKFYGTLYSKAPCFGVQPDELWLPLALPDVTVETDGRKVSSGAAPQPGIKSDSPIYNWPMLDTKDKYAVYFGGNFGCVRIKNSQTRSGGKLLIIKDSFANSLVPYLAEHYDEIIMLDLRYYNEPVTDFLQSERPDAVLVLYELVNFAQDMNLFKLTK